MAKKITNRVKTPEKREALLGNAGNVKETPEKREAFVHPPRMEKIFYESW